MNFFVNLINSKFLKLLLIIICFFFIYKNISLNSFLFINFNKDLNYYLIVIFLCILVIKLYSFLHFVTIKKILTKNYIIYKDWLFIFLISNFLSAVPFLGIFYRAYSLKKLNLSYINFATYVFTIKFLFLILTFLFITFELYFFFKINIFFYFLAFLLAIFFSFLIYIFFINKVINYYFFRKINNIYKVFLSLVLNLKYLMFFLIFFIFIHFIEIFIFYLITIILKLNIPFLITFILYLTNIIIDYLPVLPQNVGVTELTMGLVGKNLGVDFFYAISIKIFLRIFFLIANLIAVCIYVPVYLLFQKVNK